MARLENEFVRVTFVPARRADKSSVRPALEIKTTKGWSPAPLDASAATLRTFAALGGPKLQFNVVSVDTLRERIRRKSQLKGRQVDEASLLEVRALVGPVITAALEGEGLQPRNIPERVAFRKIVEELLDRIVTQGFLSFGHIRDTLSQNNLVISGSTSNTFYYRIKAYDADGTSVWSNTLIIVIP